jgi:hypothetical protein
MKTIKYLFVLVAITFLLSSCDLVSNPGRKFDKMEPPIILVAESPKGAVTVCDSRGAYVTFGEEYYLAQTISASYNKGDTLKFLNGKK